MIVCPDFQKNDKIFKNLIQTVGLPYYIVLQFFLEILKKGSENDQLTGHFQIFFIYFFFSSPRP